MNFKNTYNLEVDRLQMVCIIITTAIKTSSHLLFFLRDRKRVAHSGDGDGWGSLKDEKIDKLQENSYFCR